MNKFLLSILIPLMPVIFGVAFYVIVQIWNVWGWIIVDVFRG